MQVLYAQVLLSLIRKDNDCICRLEMRKAHKGIEKAYLRLMKKQKGISVANLHGQHICESIMYDAKRACLASLSDYFPLRYRENAVI